MENRRKINITLLGLLTFFSLLAGFFLFKSGFYYSHDGILHTVRLALFDKALGEGQIIPRWSQQLAYGSGSPVLMFYGVLPNFVGTFFHFIGLNYQDAIKSVLLSSFVFSAISFYFFLRNRFGLLPSFVGALFYIWAPYRFIDVYVRGAIPESFAFIFPPLIFLSGEKILERNSGFWLFINSISICCLILSHNVLAVIFVGIYFFYILYRSYFLKRNFLHVLISIFFGIGISSFFLLPALIFQNQIRLESLSSSLYYLQNFSTLRQIIYSPWGWGTLNSTIPMSTQLGAAQWLGIAICCLLAVIKWKKISLAIRSDLLFFGIVFVISIFLITDQSLSFWKLFTQMQIVLYPWRFLSVAIFCAAFISAAGISMFPNKYLLFFLLIFLFYSNRNYIQVAEKFNKTDIYYSSYRGTTDVQGEFLPRSTDLLLLENCEKTNCRLKPNLKAKEQFINSPVIKISNVVSLFSLGLLFIFVKTNIFNKEK